MRDLTPDSMKCAMTMSCRAVYEITPEDLQCAAGASCPGVHAIANSGDIIIIGKRLPPELQAQIEGKVGDDEHAVIIDPALLANVVPPIRPVHTSESPPAFPSNPKAPAPYEPFDGGYRDPQVLGDI